MSPSSPIVSVTSIFTCQVRSLRRGLHDVLGSRTGALWLFSPLEQGTPRVELASLKPMGGAGHRRVDDFPGNPPFWVGYAIIENVSEHGYIGRVAIIEL